MGFFGETNKFWRLFQSYIQRGLFAFTYGTKDSLVEFLHVDNLVQAHVKAGEALSSHKNHIAVCFHNFLIANSNHNFLKLNYE